MSDRQTIGGAYAEARKAGAALNAHEDLCAERYSNIHETLSELKADGKTQSRLVVGVLLSLLAWMGVQLWNGQVSHPAPAEAHAPR